MARHLVLRLEAPLMAFGGPIVDNHGIVRDHPAASMLTGLFANALGWSRGDHEKLDRLQSRLVFGARLDRPGEPLQDFQTAQLEKDDSGWTTHGRPEGRAGGEGTYKGPHLRYRDYTADALVCVALRLEPAADAPRLDDIAVALMEPLRPLFIGRKPCVPSAWLVADWFDADTVLDALRGFPRLDETPREKPSSVRFFWPDGEGMCERSRRSMIADRRDWRAGVHGGERALREASLDLPRGRGAAP